ncbi:MAG: cob(I)yrinic acid a,c-diamide adenosyltransferase [Gemmatimonadales bacterium]|nr:MAG: cob(I)yrinic acid a,c-diamide adenosyltransferase [Gemmatimonadales bacterium]
MSEHDKADPREPVDSSPRHPSAPRPKQRTPGPYPVPPRERRTGLVLLHTGNGKGKTTAALGILLRAAGRDMKVGMLQFLKTTGVDRGEHIGARRLGIEIIPLGSGFTWLSERIEEDRELARSCWARCREALESEAYDILIFDELTYALSYGWLDHEDVLPVIAARPPGTHVVITGRNATPELVEFADLVTEMREVKHPYRTRGIGAQPGLEL